MKLSIKDGRNELYQFDTNRILLLSDDDGTVDQVEFSTEDVDGEKSWTSNVLTDPDTRLRYVNIPNEFLNGDYNRLVCYYVVADEDGQYTRTKEVFRIKTRQEPEDYYLEYTQKLTFAHIKEITEAYRDEANDAMDKAKEWATKMNFPVEGQLYSSKQYAFNASNVYGILTNFVGQPEDPKTANTTYGRIKKAESDALDAIGQSNEETDGARGDAIRAIRVAKEGAEQRIGRTDDEGLRKSALDAIGRTDSDGARGQAISALDEHAITGDNSLKKQLDEHVNGDDGLAEDLTIHEGNLEDRLEKFALGEGKDGNGGVAEDMKDIINQYTTGTGSSQMFGKLEAETQRQKGVLDNYTNVDKKKVLDDYAEGTVVRKKVDDYTKTSVDKYVETVAGPAIDTYVGQPTDSPEAPSVMGAINAKKQEVLDVYQSDLALKSDKTETESLANELDDTKKKLQEQILINARQNRQIENINYQLQDESIVHVNKMTGEDDDPAGTLSISSSKVFPYAEVDEIHGNTLVWNQYASLKPPSDRSGLTITKDEANNATVINGTASSVVGATGWWTLAYNAKGTDESYRVPKSSDGHSVFLWVKVIGGSYSNGNTRIGVIRYSGGAVDVIVPSTVGAEAGVITTLSLPSTGTFNVSTINSAKDTVFNNFKFQLYFVDLSAMGLGDVTSVSDPRLAEVKSYAYAHPSYDAGSLVDAEVTGVRSVGRNLWNETKNVASGSSNGITWSNEGDGVLFRGTASDQVNYGTVRINISEFGFKSGDTISISGASTNVSCAMYFFDENGSYITGARDSGSGATYQIPSNCVFLGLNYRIDKGVTVNEKIRVQLEKGSKTEYTPFFTSTIDLSFLNSVEDIGIEGTVIDLEKKTVTWNWGKYTFTGSESWGYSSTYKRFSTSKPVDAKPSTTAYILGGYERSTDIWSADGKDMISLLSASELLVRDTRYESASAFNDYMVGKHIVYELATPITKTFEELGMTPIDNGLAIESNGTITVECEGAQAEAKIHYAIDNRSKA